MALTLASILEPQNLFAAWLKVKGNQGCAGADGVEVAAYEKNVHARLRASARAVMAGRYEPGVLLRVPLVEEGRKPRLLAIPSVRDRVLQTAVALALTPVLDEEFEHCSYGYRAGRSRLQAIDHIAALRDAGFRWVVDADISAYFDEVEPSILLAELELYVPDMDVMALIRTWLRCPIRTPESDFCPLRGIPQGSPLSPLLANLYLDTLDEALLGQSLALVRYADDFVILCRDRASAEQALELTEEILKDLSLTLNARKTRLTHFSEGFHFLGASFMRDQVHVPLPRGDVNAQQDGLAPHRNRADKVSARTRAAKPGRRQSTAGGAIPPPGKEDTPAGDTAMSAAMARALSMRDEGIACRGASSAATTTARRAANASRSVPPCPSLPGKGPKPEKDDLFPPAEELDAVLEFDPLFRTLHLLSPGSYLFREGGRLRVKRDGEEVDSLPGHALNQIVLHGMQAVSTGVLDFAAEEGIGVHFLRWDGSHFGVLHRDLAARVDLHRRQFALDGDESFRLTTARAIVEGKIRNARLVLRRYQRNHADSATETAIDWLGNQLEELPHASDVAALRGHEGAATRAYYAGLASLLGETWHFSGRTRRPPMDPVNAMLSYGYGVLLANVLGMLALQGLYPYLGVLHSAHHGQPALASDLMEEFRPLVVDSVVLRLALSGAVRWEDFTIDEQGCRMSPDVKRALTQALEGKLNAVLTHPGNGQRMDYRRAIRHQARIYSSVVMGEASAYRAMMLR